MELHATNPCGVRIPAGSHAFVRGANASEGNLGGFFVPPCAVTAFHRMGLATTKVGADLTQAHAVLGNLRSVELFFRWENGLFSVPNV